MTIGDRVFEYISRKGMTQKEFSVRTGIPQSTISDWKSKRVNPASDKIIIICDVLGITPYELLSGLESDEYRKPDHAVIMRDSEEYYVIEGMRSLDADGRKRLMGYLDALRGMLEKKEDKKVGSKN